MNEELGKENEWGRPALTRKWLKLTPGQTAKTKRLVTFEQFIVEKLTPAGRYKKRRVMQKNRYKLKHRSNIALEIGSSGRRLKVRATNAARRKLYKTLEGVKNKRKLSSTQKSEVERLLKLKDPVYMKSIQRQITPKLRRLDSTRITKKTK